MQKCFLPASGKVVIADNDKGLGGTPSLCEKTEYDREDNRHPRLCGRDCQGHAAWNPADHEGRRESELL